MKKLFFILLMFVSFGIMAQAHLGISISEIRAYHPDKTFKKNISTEGITYYTTDMQYGNFSYWMNSDGVSYLCIQIPYNMATLNGQVEAYNKKYVINSKDSWTAYLEGGAVMQIELMYDSDSDFYYFYYVKKK